MVATILAVNRIGVEGGAKSEIGEARFLMRGLAISPPRFSRFCKRAFPPDFFEKKKNWRELLGWSPYFLRVGIVFYVNPFLAFSTVYVPLLMNGRQIVYPNTRVT